MKIWTSLSEQDLKQIASECDVRINELRRDGRAWAFTIRPVNKRDENGNRPWQRVSTMGAMGYTYPVSGKPMSKRIAAVCWHGHYAFLNRLTLADPDARVKSIMYDSRGRDQWLRMAEDSRYRNVGSMMFPVQADEPCTCHE